MNVIKQEKALKASSLLLAVSMALLPSAYAQTTAPATTPATTPAASTTTIAQLPGAPTSTTIIPTDTLPLPAVQNRMSFAENLQLRILQKLPSRFYFNSTVEGSVRDETNPFQFPKKESLMRQLPPPPIWRTLNYVQQAQLYDIVGLVARNDAVFRILPNVTAGWTLTPHTRLYGNYFMIRDQLAHSMRLNTVIHSIGMGLQQDIPVTSKGNLQAELQWRELYQLHQQSVFDFLPGLTFSYVVTPRIVLFANALLQMRGKAFFQAPTKEIDPFYTWGGLYQKNGWTFSASTTLVQNFRHPFRRNATIPVDNYSFISDFEISRRIIKQLPGLQAFCRAEPIWNFHSLNRPGLSGMDFRIFFGFRMAMAKPALTSALEQLRQQLEEQEGEPGPPAKPNKEQKPSAYIAPHELIASSPQPLHGYLDENTGVEVKELQPASAPILVGQTGAAAMTSPVIADYAAPAVENTAQDIRSALSDESISDGQEQPLGLAPDEAPSAVQNVKLQL